jgi:hypothetical protein
MLRVEVGSTNLSKASCSLSVSKTPVSENRRFEWQATYNCPPLTFFSQNIFSAYKIGIRKSNTRQSLFKKNKAKDIRELQNILQRI